MRRRTFLSGSQLLQHTGMYLLGRGVPGILNFLIIVVYTRLLSPSQYGMYVLVVAGVSLFDGILFQWLRLSLFRFYQEHRDKRGFFLSTILDIFLVLTVSAGILATAIGFFWSNLQFRKWLLLGIILLWAQGWFELNRVLVQIELQPLRFGLVSATRSTIALLIGTLLIWAGYGVYGALLGLLIGLLLSTAFALTFWRGISFRFDKPLAFTLAHYGVPLLVTFTLSYVVSTSDRFLIAKFLNKEAVGLYAAAYDLAQQSITTLMMIVNLAGYPLVLYALEHKGWQDAQIQLQQNGALLLMIGLASSVGLSILSPNITHVILGPQFQKQAVFILPWVSMAVFLAGLRAYYFDLSFQLGKRTAWQIVVMGVAAAANLLLNLWCIPQWGIQGAAYTTFLAYLIASVVSILLGRRAFHVPIFLKDWGKIIFAVIVMAAGLYETLLLTGLGLWALVLQILSGAFFLIMGILMVDIFHVRSRFLQALISEIGYKK